LNIWLDNTEYIEYVMADSIIGFIKIFMSTGNFYDFNLFSVFHSALLASVVAVFSKVEKNSK